MISIIIPLYNKESSVHNSLDSIVSQSYQDWECIVVDDSSTDNSCEVVRGYKDSRIKLFTKPNGGPSSARNYGVEKAIGEWVLFLDADDYFLPDALSAFSDGIESYPQAKVITSNFLVERNGIQGLYLMSMSRGKINNPFMSLCVRSLFIRTGNTIFKKDIVEQHPFSTTFRRYEDFECFLAIIRDYSVYYMPDTTLVYDCGHNEASKHAPNKTIDYLYNINFENSKISFWEKAYLYGVLKDDQDIEVSTLYPYFKGKHAYCLADIGIRACVKLKLIYYRMLGQNITLY